MQKLSYLIFIPICCLTTSAFAAVYKCNDNNRISYQDTRCERGIEIVTKIPDNKIVYSKTDENATNIPPDNITNAKANFPTTNPDAMLKSQNLNNNPTATNNGTNIIKAPPLLSPEPLSSPTNNLNNSQEKPGISQEQIQQVLNSMQKTTNNSNSSQEKPGISQEQIQQVLNSMQKTTK